MKSVRSQGLRGRVGTAYHLWPTGEFFSLLNEHFLGQLILADDHCRCGAQIERIDGTISFLQLEEIDMHVPMSGEKWQAAHNRQEWEALGVLGTKCL